MCTIDESAGEVQVKVLIPTFDAAVVRGNPAYLFLRHCTCSCPSPTNVESKRDPWSTGHSVQEFKIALLRKEERKETKFKSPGSKILKFRLTKEADSDYRLSLHVGIPNFRRQNWGTWTEYCLYKERPP